MAGFLGSQLVKKIEIWPQISNIENFSFRTLLARFPDTGLLLSQKLRLKTEEENRIHLEIETFLRKEQQVGPQNFSML